MAINLGKVTLEKKGEQRTLSLDKGATNQTIHVNLNWDAPAAAPKKGLLGSLFGGGAPSAPDLDLGVIYRLKNGQKGVIDALNRNFGSKSSEPFIFLDKDDRSGAAADGENLFFFRPQDIDLAIVIASIYEGAPDFSSVGTRLTLKDVSGSETLIHLSSPERGRNYCVVSSVRATDTGVVITKEERYFEGAEQADAAFGFGFHWTAGSK